VEYKDYAIQYFLCILEVEFGNGKGVVAPKGGPDWVVRLVDYLLCEYANSHNGLYALGREFSLASDFSDLKSRLKNINDPDLARIFHKGGRISSNPLI